MVALGLLLVVLALSWYLLAGRGTGSFTIMERVFLALTPLPVILMFAIPLLLDALRLGSAVGAWKTKLEPASIWASAGLVLSGVVLVWRRFARNADRQGRLTAGIFLAGIPVLLALAVGLLYSIGHRE